MEAIREYEEGLLPPAPEPLPGSDPQGLRLVVLKSFRFHKALQLELYEAALTREGKLRNPLKRIEPSDAALTTSDPEALLFYACLGRFQQIPTAAPSAADFRALKTIIKNPLGLSFYRHDPQFSENLSAGSLRPVAVGQVLRDLSLQVTKEGRHYRIIPRVQVGGRFVEQDELQPLFDYFLRLGEELLLVDRPALMRILRFFNGRSFLEISEALFPAFEERILRKLEDEIPVIHTYVEEATHEQIEAAGLEGAQERIIYLTDLDPYVLIRPVMRYGSTELPLRSQKQLYLPDARGRLMALPRDEAAEDRFMSILLRQHPLFTEQLEDSLPYFYLHRDRFLDENWFLEAFHQWREAGITIFGFRELKGNKKNAHQADVRVQVRSGLNWFNAQLQVAFGAQRATMQQLQQALRNKSRYVTLDDGSLGLLPEARIERMKAFFEAAEVVEEELVFASAQFDTVDQLFERSECDAAVTTAIQDFRSRLTQIDTIEAVAPPAGLRARLSRYQLQGLSWLRFLDKHGFGGILADDMGLGKTVQVIALLQLLKEEGGKETHLVVLPTSLLFNWQSELERFAPGLRVHLLYGAGRERCTKGFEDVDVVLTTYGTLLSDSNYLRRYAFGYVILDEAQQIKNTDSQSYRAVRLLQARNRLSVTGTPIENNTLDLFAQVSFVNPGLLGNRRYFRDVYSNPIDVFEDRRRSAELQRKVAPFILRRTKAAIAGELPDKTEQVLLCPMGASQRTMYLGCEQELRDYLEGTMKDEVERSAIHVLRGLTQLRQICDDPRLVKSDTLRGEGSAKLQVLLEQIALRAPQQKILVFSQFVSMLDLVGQELDGTGTRYVRLTGATKDRAEVVRQFQEDESVRVFLLSLKAGGTGLNLTAASCVFLLDPWWNPAVEQQAIDRAYRIGQHQNVQAFRLICPDTVEEKILSLQESKRARFAGLVQGGEGLPALTMEDWKEVLGARRL